jgi:hypothetical protein
VTTGNNNTNKIIKITTTGHVQQHAIHKRKDCMLALLPETEGKQQMIYITYMGVGHIACFI